MPVCMTVAADQAGLRLDAFLARTGAAPSAAAARRLIAAGCVRVDDRAAPKGARLEAGQMVMVTEERAVPAAVFEEIPLVVLYEDPDLVAVAKPSGIPSHPLRAHQSEGPTVAGGIVARYPECATAGDDPREGGLGHRLDRGTSGVLIAARQAEVWGRLRTALGDVDCEKIYLAEVVGRPRIPTVPAGEAFLAPGSAPESVLVTAPIGRSGRRGSRVRVGGGRGPMPARTEVRVIENRGDTTLVEARLSKGRPHQVRAHLAYLGSPVVGDATYGQTEHEGELRLHAASVTLRHPRSGRPLCIEAPLPAWALRVGPGDTKE